MKKLISLILILCMACLLIPAVAEEDITGDWYLTSMTMNGVSVDLSSGMMSLSFHLNADGTLTQTGEIMGEKSEQEGTWTMEGDKVTMTVDGQAQEAVYADGQLTLESEGQVGILSREAPSQAEAPKTVAAESEEAFFGTWTLSAVDMMGVRMSTDQIEGYTGSITIEAGKIISNLQMGEGQEAQQSEAATTFEDGKLTAAFELSETEAELLKAMGMDASATVATIELVEDGSLVYTMEFMGMPMSLYCTKAAE